MQPQSGPTRHAASRAPPELQPPLNSDTRYSRLERFLAVIGAAVLAVSCVGALLAAAERGPGQWPSAVEWMAAATWPGLGGRHADAGPPDSVIARVERVVDGDTLVIDGGMIVRLLAVDAPETSNPNMTGPQPYGEEAATRLASLVAGRNVALERDVSDVDHYGRLLRHVWIGDELVSEVLLREGLARSGSMPPDVRYAERLRNAERDAELHLRGLWGEPRPTSLPIFGVKP